MSESIHGKQGDVYEMDGSRHCYTCRQTWDVGQAEPDTCAKVLSKAEEMAALRARVAELEADLAKYPTGSQRVNMLDRERIERLRAVLGAAREMRLTGYDKMEMTLFERAFDALQDGDYIVE